MKKTILTFAFGFTCSLLFAQAKSNAPNLTDPKALLAAVRFTDPFLYESTNPAPVNEISTRAFKDFRKAFRDVKDEKWFTLPNGYLAEFMIHDAKSVTVYDSKGNWKFTICYYGEKSLPDEIRATVKSVFYDYSITLVEEIRIQEKVIYLVHMQNESTWKNIRVSDGEMDVIEDFDKK
jgi:hypothetical protein